MSAFYARILKAEAILAAVLLLLMVALVFLGGVARLLHQPLNWTIDLATCSFAWAAFLAADVAWRNGSLISIGLLTDVLPPRVQKLIQLLNYLIISAFLLFVIVGGVWLSYVSRARSFQGIPGVSYSWVTLSMPVGAALLLTTTLLKARAQLFGDPPAPAASSQPV